MNKLDIDSIKKKYHRGKTFKHYNGFLHHVVGYFSDGDQELIITKYWSKYKRRWYYHTELIEVFAFDIHLFEQIKLS